MLRGRKLTSLIAGLAFLLQTAGLPAIAAIPLFASKDTQQQRCDALAAAPMDPRTAAGVDMDQIDVDQALPACQEAARGGGDRAHYQFLYGRVLEASKRYGEAAQEYR